MEKEEEEEEEQVVRVKWEGGAIDCIALVKDIIAYVLFTHHQIPQLFAQLEHDTVDHLVVDSNGASSLSERREKNRIARAMKKEMRNRQKLIGSIQALLDALQAALKELSYIPSVLLILGSSSKQPFAAYDIQFHDVSPFSLNEDMQASGKSSNLAILTKSFSKKITRALVSRDTAPSFTGPMKLFMFIKADATSHMPQAFVPKRGYTAQFRKASVRLLQIIGTTPLASKDDVADSIMDENISSYSDLIWFQCKMTIKGGQCRDIL